MAKRLAKPRGQIALHGVAHEVEDEIDNPSTREDRAVLVKIDVRGMGCSSQRCVECAAVMRQQGDLMLADGHVAHEL